jgi:hypothetical protein
MYRSRRPGKRTGRERRPGGAADRTGAGAGAGPGAASPPSGATKDGSGAARLQEEKRPNQGQDDVRTPHPQERRQTPVHGRLLPGREQSIVKEDDDQAQRKASGAASAAGHEAEGQSEEGKDEAGRRERELLVDLDPMGANLARVALARRRRIQGGQVPGELSDVLLPNPLLARDRREEAFDVDLLLQSFERGQRVSLRVGGGPGVDDAVRKLKDRPPFPWVQADDPRAGHDQPGIRGIIRHVGEDIAPDVIPVGLADEEDHARQGFVEHERLDLELDAGQDGMGHRLDPGAVGPRRDDHGDRESQEKSAEPENEHGKAQTPRPDAE